MATPASPPSEDVFRQFVIPLLATYVLFIVMLVVHARPRADGRDGGVRGSQAAVGRTRQRSWGQLLRFLFVTVTGGYLCFLLVVALYYWFLVNQTPRFLKEAVIGGAFLAYCVVLPAFLLLSWLEHIGRKRRADRARTQQELTRIGHDDGP